MKEVVTGRAGFIGSNLVRAAGEVEQLGEIVVVNDPSTRVQDNLLDLPVRGHVLAGQ